VRSENTDIPGNIGIFAHEVAARRAEIFDPYHAAISHELDQRAAVGRPAVLITMHSFTPVYDGVTRRMHAAVLYNRDPRLARALFDRLATEPGLVVGDNDPYAVSDEGDYAIPVHGERRALPHVEIEIRQDLITYPDGQAEWIDRLARLIPAAAVDAGV
jgi:predicted N-formylglutamate amidohydrolase